MNNNRMISEAKAAVQQDWTAEYLDLVIAVKVVDSMDLAIDHIIKYGSNHIQFKSRIGKFLKMDTV